MLINIFASYFVGAVFYQENVGFPNQIVMRQSVQTESFSEINVKINVQSVIWPTLSSVCGTI